MKKFLLILISLVLSLPAFNQEMENILLNKNGIKILPEKGDIAIGIDAVPFLNLLNNNGSSPGFNFVNNIPAISLKYFNTNSSALRMSFQLGYSTNNYEYGDGYFDKDSNNSYGLNLGYERRLGKSRVQGFYGLDGGFLYQKTKNSNQSENSSGGYDYSTIGFNTAFILGAEVFFMTKLSAGGQFSWGPSYSIQKGTDNTYSLKRFSLGAGNASGALMLLLHF